MLRTQILISSNGGSVFFTFCFCLQLYAFTGFAKAFGCEICPNVGAPQGFAKQDFLVKVKATQLQSKKILRFLMNVKQIVSCRPHLRGRRSALSQASHRKLNENKKEKPRFFAATYSFARNNERYSNFSAKHFHIVFPPPDSFLRYSSMQCCFFRSAAVFALWISRFFKLMHKQKKVINCVSDGTGSLYQESRTQ